MPKTKLIAAPAIMPAATPAQWLPESWATANAAIAPTDMMPSAPRFSTPDFSVMSSPSAVMMSGVPAMIVANSIEVTMLSTVSSYLTAAARRSRYWMKTSEPSRKKSSMPWNTLEIDDGRFMYCCACSPPM